jgi:hypothetical protein
VLVAGRRLVEGDRQVVAGGKLAALEAADAGARIGRQAAHERAERQAAGHREIGGVRTLDHADPQDLAALQEMRAVRFERLGRSIVAFDQRRGERPRERNAHRLRLNQKVGAHHADLEPGSVGWIAGQRIGERQPDAVHRAGGRHAERHVADAAEILHGVEQAGPHHPQRAHGVINSELSL